MTFSPAHTMSFVSAERRVIRVDAPIGVIDSGLGGISVVNAIRDELPNESIAYFADTANCPYGTREPEFVLERLVTITQHLVDQGIKLLVLACNTGSAVGLEALRARFAIPIVGLEPAVKPAVLMTRTGRICVLATPQTIRSRRLDDLISRHAAGVDVIRHAAPNWVELVEAGHIEGCEAEDAVTPVIEMAIDAGCDVIVLGCTHFPLLRGPLDEIARGRVQFVDSGPAVAKRTGWLLATYAELACEHEVQPTINIGTSGDPLVVEPRCRALLH